MWTCKETEIKQSIFSDPVEKQLDDKTMTDREMIRLLTYFLNDRDKSTVSVIPLWTDSESFREELRADGVHVKEDRCYGYIIEHTIAGMTIRYHLEDHGPDHKQKPSTEPTPREYKSPFEPLLKLFRTED